MPSRDPETGQSRSGLTFALWVVAVGCWILAMSMIGFDKPQHDSMDPVSRAAYNRQQNLLWGEHVFWVCALPALGAIVGAVTASIRHNPSSAPHTGLRTATGALVGSLASLAAVSVFFVQAAASSSWQF